MSKLPFVFSPEWTLSENPYLESADVAAQRLTERRPMETITPPDHTPEPSAAAPSLTPEVFTEPERARIITPSKRAPLPYPESAADGLDEFEDSLPF